jgi:hypothetical protein
MFIPCPFRRIRVPPLANRFDDTVGAPGVRAVAAGTYALTVRYSNSEQSPASHCNPGPPARHADIALNGGTARRG